MTLGRPLHGLGLPRVERPRLRLRRVARLRRRRGDGRHRRAQPADRRGQAALRPPRAPGLRDPRAVPAVHPAGLGHRPVGQARALRRDGARRRRRRGRRAPAVPLAEGVRRAASSTASPRSRSRPGWPSRSRTCIPGGPRRAEASRCTCPGWDPSDENYAQRHHRPLARRDRAVVAGGDGEAARRPAAPRAPDRRLAARPRTSTWCRAAAPWTPPGFLRAPGAPAASAATSCSRSTPARRRPEEREADLRESLEFARAAPARGRDMTAEAASRGAGVDVRGLAVDVRRRAAAADGCSTPRPRRRRQVTGLLGPQRLRQDHADARDRRRAAGRRRAPSRCSG